MNLGRTLFITTLPLLLANCGEYQQHVEYTDGGYQGKQDQRAWDNESALHDRSAWKQIISERTQRQNEYGRTKD
jgi:hypothetical protein